MRGMIYRTNSVYHKLMEKRRHLSEISSEGGEPMDTGTITFLDQKSGALGLPDLVKYAKLLHMNNLELSDDMTMRESKEYLENRILEEIHPYKIYENKGMKNQWATYLPDPTRPYGRRLLKRNSYERVRQAVIEFYLDKLHLDITMEKLFDEWALFRRDETAAKTGTVRKDVSLWKTHIRQVEIEGKALEAYKVSEITPKLLYSFFRKLTKDRAYSKQTVTNIRGVLNGMFAYAIEHDIIETNPSRDIDLKRLPYKPVQDKSDEVYTREEAQTLIRHLAPLREPYALAIRLDFNMFIRVGEIAGLKWENIDLERRNAYICHQVTYEPELNDDLTFSEKKMVTEDYLKGCTSQGYRNEYLTDEAIEILKVAREINPDGEYVFMPFGKPIITTTFNKRLKKYCGEVCIPYRSSHKIRFYAASTAYNGENLPVVSRLMGHSQISTTMHYLRDVIQDNNYADAFQNLGRQNPA